MEETAGECRYKAKGGDFKSALAQTLEAAMAQFVEFSRSAVRTEN